MSNTLFITEQLQSPGTKRKYLSNSENAEEEKYSVIGIMMMMMYSKYCVFAKISS